MAGKSIHCRVGEASLSRASFNSLVNQDKLDVTEEMMKAAVIGRMAEIEGFEASGIVSRKIALILQGQRPGAQALKIEPVRPRQRAEVPGAGPPATGRSEISTERSARLMSYKPTAEKPTWTTMMNPVREVGSPGALSGAGNALLRSTSEVRLPPPLHPPSGDEGATATKHWTVKEHALNRDSFNAHVRHKKLDVTAVMMRDAQMSTSAMMGPGWQPGGVISRQIAEILTKGKA
jgi:hypothetical protein